MTIKEVLTHILRESLLAIADLGRKYRGDEMVTAYKAGLVALYAGYRCPLCRFHCIAGGYRSVETTTEECFCPWVWIEGHECENVAFDGSPIPDRLVRIARWEELINAELAGRAE